jgi:hypothetical protein
MEREGEWDGVASIARSLMVEAWTEERARAHLRASSEYRLRVRPRHEGAALVERLKELHPDCQAHPPPPRWRAAALARRRAAAAR